MELFRILIDIGKNRVHLKKLFICLGCGLCVGILMDLALLFNLAGVPFAGPLGAARVGYKDGEYLLNPGKEALETSDLDLVVAGTNHAVLMVESEAKILSEEVMLGAVMFVHEQMQTVITAMSEFAAEAGSPKWEYTAAVADEALAAKVAETSSTAIIDAYQIAEKMARQDAVKTARRAAVEALTTDDGW